MKICLTSSLTHIWLHRIKFNEAFKGCRDFDPSFKWISFKSVRLYKANLKVWTSSSQQWLKRSQVLIHQQWEQFMYDRKGQISQHNKVLKHAVQSFSLQFKIKNMDHDAKVQNIHECLSHSSYRFVLIVWSELVWEPSWQLVYLQLQRVLNHLTKGLPNKSNIR